MGNIHVNLSYIWTSGVGVMSFKEKVYAQSMTHDTQCIIQNIMIFIQAKGKSFII